LLQLGPRIFGRGWLSTGKLQRDGGRARYCLILLSALNVILNSKLLSAGIPSYLFLFVSGAMSQQLTLFALFTAVIKKKLGRTSAREKITMLCTMK
jgi:hypothetical protein